MTDLFRLSQTAATILAVCYTESHTNEVVRNTGTDRSYIIDVIKLLVKKKYLTVRQPSQKKYLTTTNLGKKAMNELAMFNETVFKCRAGISRWF